MDETVKNKIGQAKAMIQKKEYRQALDELSVLVYKYAKLYQVHLMAGLCYDKLGNHLEAEKCYLQALDLKPGQQNAIKALCDIYDLRKDMVNLTKYLEYSLSIFKDTDDRRYRETLMTLVGVYERELNIEKIDVVFMQYVKDENVIGEDFVFISNAHFKTSVTNQCFNLQKLELMGVFPQAEEGTLRHRPILGAAREPLNDLLCRVVTYTEAAAPKYGLSLKDTANAIFQLRQHFPEASCMLMLLLNNEFCVGHIVFSQTILLQLYKLLSAYFNRIDNCYLNLQFTQPQLFTTCMVLGYEYLAFLKEFFTLDSEFVEYFDRLALSQQQFLQGKLSEKSKQKLNNFILRECRLLNHRIDAQVQRQLQNLKQRIQRINDSYLQQIIARMAMNCFGNYQKLDDMKNLLKVRIKNHGEEVPCYLYKYYFDYLLKIAKMFRVMDEDMLPLKLLQEIVKQDAADLKYFVQREWMMFCQGIVGEQGGQGVRIQAEMSLGNLQRVLNQLGPLRAQGMRKIAILKMYAGDYEVEDELRHTLNHQHSFVNLQCYGIFQFYRGNIELALTMLKEAFAMNQSHYHVNRIIFFCLFKLNKHKQALSFLARIREGFSSVFWVNYFLAIARLNQNNYSQAQKMMSAALEAFQSGTSKTYSYSYQKTATMKDFSIPVMIQQNLISILYDQIVLPEQSFNELPQLSSLYFTKDTPRKHMNLLVKMSQILKILGRTKSALNCLIDGNLIANTFTVEDIADPLLRLQVCLFKKQYSTLLFYMQQLKESQEVLQQAYFISEKMGEESVLWGDINAEIKALAFEISVQRLANMMKFQSYEYLEKYIALFEARIVNMSYRSLNFMKSKYQFHILKFLHRRKRKSFTKDQQAQQTKTVLGSIVDLLSHFGITLSQSSSQLFCKTLFDLPQLQIQVVRQCLQDCMVIRYLSDPSSIPQRQVMTMMQLFPRSTVFCIVYGMVTTDLSRRTSAFIKCIQLDRDSPISVDLLASLYLQQRKYLSACKLFLKSLELNILNSKCYLGLAICLFCLITHTLKEHKDQQRDMDIIRRSVIRINSYMEYLRIADPSENYHMLRFLKLLIGEQQASSFNVRTTLQASEQAVNKFRGTLMKELLERSVRLWNNGNIWSDVGQVEVFALFIKQRYGGLVQYRDICLRIVNDVGKRLDCLRVEGRQEQHQKKLQVLLHQLSICMIMLKKSGFHKDIFEMIIDLLRKDEWDFSGKAFEIIKMKKQAKQILYDIIFLDTSKCQLVKTVQQIFPDIQSFSYISKYYPQQRQREKQIRRCLLRSPANEELRSILATHLILKGFHVIKPKVSYKLQLLNELNNTRISEKTTLKKLMLLENDINAFVSYIAVCWREPVMRTPGALYSWLRTLQGLKRRAKAQSNTQMQKKIQSLQLQMHVFIKTHPDCQESSQKQNIQTMKNSLSKVHHRSIQLRTSLHSLTKHTFSKHIKDNLSLCYLNFDIEDESHQWSFTQFLATLVNQDESNSKLTSLLTKTITLLNHPKVKTILRLLTFISCLHRRIETQQHLLDQVTEIADLVAQCGDAVTRSTQTILNCGLALLRGDYDTLELQLQHSAQNKLVTYSDQVAVNFYQVIRAYKSAQKDMNDEELVDTFVRYTNSMIGFLRDPYYQGFFFALKGMINSLLLGMDGAKIDRNIKVALLCSPIAARVLITGK